MWCDVVPIASPRAEPAGAPCPIPVDTPACEVPCKRPRQDSDSPDCSHREAHQVCDPRAAQWLSSMHLMLYTWLERLHCEHPLCQKIPPEVVTLALALFREYVAQTGMSLHFAMMQPLITTHALGVSLWTSIKWMSNPDTVPSARLLGRAAGLEHKLLVALEPEVLGAVGWNVWAIAKLMGLAPSTPMAED